MARFFNTQLVRPISQYAPAPLEYIDAAGAQRQHNQDIGVKSVEILGKEITPLSIDRPRAFEKKQEIDSQIEQARSFDYNTPQGQKQAFDLTKKLRDEFNDFGEAGAINKRTAQFQANLKDIEDDKDSEPWMKELYTQELSRQIDPRNPNANLLNYNPKTGGYNSIQSPEKFTKINGQDWLTKALATIHANKDERGLSKVGNLDEFTTAYKSGTLEYKDAERVKNILLNYADSDNNLKKYYQKSDEYQGVKSGSSLSKLIQGGIEAATYHEENPNYHFNKNDKGLIDYKRKIEEDTKRTYESALSIQGDKSVADLSEMFKSEPSNSVLSKIVNFLHPANAAQGLMNVYKAMVPFSEYDPRIIGMQKELSKRADLSEDQMSDKIDKIGFGIKQKIASDQKDFRARFGFASPIFDQSYDIVDLFTKDKDGVITDDYKRAEEITKSSNRNYDKLSNEDKFDTITKAMADHVESSKLNNILVPMTKEMLNFRNSQLANVSGTPDEKTEQLMNLGVAANGKFIDFQTQKETPLSEVVKSGQLKYIGQLDNQNQTGPAMDYYQGGDGKFYLSPGSLEDRKANYFDWSLNQTKNRYSREFETPLIFDDSRDSRNFKEDGVTPQDNVPSIRIRENLKTNQNDIFVTVGDIKITTSNVLTEDVYRALVKKGIDPSSLTDNDISKANITYKLRESGLTEKQVNKLGL